MGRGDLFLETGRSSRHSGLTIRSRAKGDKSMKTETTIRATGYRECSMGKDCL
jgi:hypothetical protein